MTQNSGIAFLWHGGPTSRHNMPEQNGGGVALFDFDGDKNLDVLLTNCGTFGTGHSPKTLYTSLFRNVDHFRFDDNSQQSRLQDSGSAMGVSTGDINSDGFPDIFVACYGENQIYMNCGDGTFENVTRNSKVSGSDWSTSCALADLNGDSHLDIYVVNYVDWTPQDAPCRDPAHPEQLRICSPSSFKAVPDQLYVNGGDGTFQESGSKAGISDDKQGKGLALTIADFTHDGLLDIFVANDTTPNSLFVNQSSAGFVNDAIAMGVAVSSDGTHGASMGVACSDYNRDGNFDLFVSNFRNQSNDLFDGLGPNGFVPARASAAIDMSSRSKLAFGVVFSDFDLDGWPDIFVANGHIWDLSHSSGGIDYEMTAELLQNINGQSFRNISETTGEYFSQKWLGRSVSAGDIDNDGATDLVVQHVGKPLHLLRNASSVKSNSVLLDIVGTKHCREPLGCRVEVSVAEETSVMHIPSGGSFQASLDRRLLLRVPHGQTLDSVTISWPDGTTDAWHNIPIAGVDLITLTEGSTQSHGLSSPRSIQNPD